ncbi:MAG: anthranilate synthase component I family protein, partial [Tumebacillaceae bacterium]
MSVAKITVRTRQKAYPRVCESFEVFQALTETFGAQSAFLLDSVKNIHSGYCASSIALFPVLTVRVKGRQFQIDSESLAEPVLAHLAPLESDLNHFSGNVSRLLEGVVQSFDLQDRLTMGKYSFGFVGHFSYDSIRYFEN